MAGATGIACSVIFIAIGASFRSRLRLFHQRGDFLHPADDYAAIVLPAQCQVDPETKPECVTDKYALFVAPPPLGQDGNDGTMARPLATITAAINASGTSKVLVFVCGGATAYAEQVKVTTPVSIYGGFSCSGGTWAWSARNVTNVVQPASTTGPALTISNVAAPITIGYLSFTAQPAVTAGDSSIAEDHAIERWRCAKGRLAHGRHGCGRKGAAGRCGLPGYGAGRKEGRCQRGRGRGTGAQFV